MLDVRFFADFVGFVPGSGRSRGLRWTSVSGFKRTLAATPEIQLQHLLLAYGLVAQPALLPFQGSSVKVGAGP